MPTTRTPNAALQMPATADRGWDAPLNANSQQLDSTPAIGSLCVTQHEYPSTTLLVNVAAGTFVNAAGAYASYAGQSGLALPANSTTRLWVTDSGSLVTGLAWPNPGTNHVRLATVTTGASNVSAITDSRTPFRSASS
jgi:hypothetical protein